MSSSNTASSRTRRRAHEGLNDGRVRGGVLVSGGAASSSGLAPREGLMAGARLEVAMPLPTLPGRPMGAPWTRDFIGLALEGGVLGGHHGGAEPAAIDVRPDGLGRLTFQLPLRNDLRPFVAGELSILGCFEVTVRARLQHARVDLANLLESETESFR